MRVTLFVLNALVAGGCIALMLVRSVLLRVFAAAEMHRADTGKPASAEQIWESISPLYSRYGIALMTLLALTCCLWAVGRLRAGQGGAK